MRRGRQRQQLVGRGSGPGYADRFGGQREGLYQLQDREVRSQWIGEHFEGHIANGSVETPGFGVLGARMAVGESLDLQQSNGVRDVTM